MASHEGRAWAHSNDPHKIFREAESTMAFSIQKSESRPYRDGAGHCGSSLRAWTTCVFAPLRSLLRAGTAHTDEHGLSGPDHVVGESSRNFTEKSVLVKFPVCFC